MSAPKTTAGTTVEAAAGTDAAAPVAKFSKKRMLLLAIPVLLIAAGAGAWFTGLTSKIPGLKPAPPPVVAATGPPPPVYVEMPEIVANLNAGNRRSAFVKIQARLELSKPEDVAIFTAAQPRVMDLFQTYLREMRPDELRGSIGTYRLREQLIARASLVVAPARVVDVLFTELLVQ